ncbi:MAG TPA: SRPBCC family protein [Dehalococcoidia bacterium]|nr:SRPBCC family protein [Dehalococcoidia bacterium]
MDVTCEIVIHRPREVVAAYAENPSNDCEWIGGIKEARALSHPAVGEGARVERIARFLGRRIAYVLETTEYEPNVLIAMQSVQGPFRMRVTYRFEDTVDGTRFSIRNEGGSGIALRLGAPLMSKALRRNVNGDLRRLKDLLESDGAG